MEVDELEPEPAPETEWKLRAVAVPAALGLAIVFHASATGHWLQRTFLSMMIHELGHAVTAWGTGFAAMPTLWKTMIPETRSIAVTVVVVAVFGFVAWRAWTARRTWVAGGLAAVIALALWATCGVSVERAQAAITFGGDGGAMVLGTLLMTTMFVGPASKLRTGHVRWGLLVIGSAAFVDTFATWWAARTNPDVIPFGEIEGVGLSDPSKLDEVYGWTTHQIVGRYVTLGVACALVLSAAWLYATWKVREAARAVAPADRN
jgi:hypothetical protein